MRTLILLPLAVSIACAQETFAQSCRRQAPSLTFEPALDYFRSGYSYRNRALKP
jgi:hypothetical protein